MEADFIPLSQKISFSPPNDEATSASASELLFSELAEKNELLEKAQKEAQDYKLKCEALLTTLSDSTRKRHRENAEPEAAAAQAVCADEAPRKKPSPTPAPPAVEENPIPAPCPDLVEESDDDDDSKPLISKDKQKALEKGGGDGWWRVYADDGE